MSLACWKCDQCQKECNNKNELFADTCGHNKCRECVQCASFASCSLCANTSAAQVQAVSAGTKLPLPTKKTSKISSQTHIKEEFTAVGTVQYHCTACGKIFRSRSQKYYHLQCNQANDELYECNVCKKTFARQSQLKYHRESHVSPINNCPKCQKTFANPLALKKHEALHNVEPKPCPHCDKTFFKKMSLDEHIAAQHLQQLPYECALCNKKYASKSTLQLHLQSHEKKRFECCFCGKYFQRNSILNLHLKRHSHTNSHKCSMCGKAFSESGALARHRRIHEENTLQYHCTLCDKSIMRKDNMTRHVNTIHPEENFEDIVLIIQPLADNKNEQASNKQHPLAVDNKRLEFIEQSEDDTSFGNSQDDANGIKGHEATNQKNILIIGNRILQKSDEMPKKGSGFVDDTRNICKTDDIKNVNTKKDFIFDDTSTHLTTDKMTKAVITQIQVIKPFINIHEQINGKLKETSTSNTINTNEKLMETSTNNTKSCLAKQNQYNSSHSLSYEECGSCVHSLTKTASEYNNYESHKTYCNSKKASRMIIPSNSYFSPTASNYSDTIDQGIHNKASVIRSIGNVRNKKTITTASTPFYATITQSTEPNTILSDFEYKHKKYNRHYNVDLYRKILGCDDNDDDDDEKNNNENPKTEKQDSSCDATTATPVHWRKSFKNSYETSTL